MLLHKLLWLQVQNLVVSRVKVECLLANELIVDPGVLEQKLARIRMVGLERFFVVADWDRTLTRAQTVDGEDTTSYLAVVQGGYLGEGYREEMDRLYREYRPIEVSQTASSEQKTEAMHNWWTAAFELMRTYGLTEVMVEDVAGSGPHGWHGTPGGSPGPKSQRFDDLGVVNQPSVGRGRHGGAGPPDQLPCF